MNKRILNILSMYALLMSLAKEFEVFESSCSNNPVDEEYISSYMRSKVKDEIRGLADVIWSLLGITTNFDLKTLCSAVEEDMKLAEKEIEDAD